MLVARLLGDLGEVPIEIGVALIALVMFAGFGAIIWWFRRVAVRDRHLGHDVYIDQQAADTTEPNAD